VQRRRDGAEKDKGKEQARKLHGGRVTLDGLAVACPHRA
jgi:hypothetical protein